MFNHNRGLWGYTGTALDGAPLTVQSTGIGGPSAAVVLEELCDLGLRCAVRVGTCAALDSGAALGELVAVREVLAADGTSRALGTPERLAGDEALTAALAARADRAGAVVSSDLFYDERAGERAAWVRAGALAVDLETAAVLAVAHRRGIGPLPCWPSSHAAPSGSTPTRSPTPACGSATRRSRLLGRSGRALARGARPRRLRLGGLVGERRQNGG